MFSSGLIDIWCLLALVLNLVLLIVSTKLPQYKWILIYVKSVGASVPDSASRWETQSQTTSPLQIVATFKNLDSILAEASVLWNAKLARTTLLIWGTQIKAEECIVFDNLKVKSPAVAAANVSTPATLVHGELNPGINCSFVFLVLDDVSLAFLLVVANT